MRKTNRWLVLLGLLIAGAANAQTGQELLDAKGCLGCHGIDEKSMGPALREAAAKHQGAEASLIAALKAGKGHPMPVEATNAELNAMLQFLAAAPATDAKVAGAPAARPDNAVCLSCHGNEGFEMPGADGQMRSLHVAPEKFAASVHGPRQCIDCHRNFTEIPHPESALRKDAAASTEWRLSIPDTCGACHTQQRKLYATSVHGKEVLENRNVFAAVCSDCHTMHDVGRTQGDPARLVIASNCGSCHVENYKSYTGTYHGKVNVLGYAYTAKCFDCHGSHAIQRVDHPASTVHPDNRLGTCQKCHANATAGFVTFEPHATSDDFDRFPHVWIATKSMIALLLGVFAFFWTHTALWFYREYRDRQARKQRPHVRADESLQLQGKQYQRFGPLWRLAHLAFALSVMTLVLTGMAVFFAETAWAKVVIDAFGSPKVAAIVHRVAAAVMLGIFFVHLVVLAIRIGRHWRTFKWFGPESLVPNWQDLKDIIAMFKWFLGRGPRPVFERWTYWEKFDYWAVFWGMAIIGGSGFMLAVPTLTASLLPGWVFNVANIVHGEEAVLAAVFLFTVHFFNNHFRPDKFPLDLVMFTGAVPLEEFRREHALEYRRLLETGQLEKYLVDAPSRPLTLGSRILGFTLIAIGLALLVLVVAGFAGRAG
jgi:cytochrome b subunit of formate dehydrogenase/nitrate/TMAO reductase-like tetraheme cytochrome c subunit